jgi:hypothetical protein
VTALAIEVNDVALVAVRDGATYPLPESPGVALLDGARLRVGAEAAAEARLKPRFVHDGYWEHLDTEAAGVPFPAGLRRADLAHAQLAAIRGAAGPGITEAFLAVPGSWSAPALGLLLSVARAAGLPVVGLVDAAVAAASLNREAEALLHLDLTRHRSVVTAMTQKDEVARTRVATVEGRGWTAFEGAWADAVALAFVRETRFDPRHGGASEQALHEALPGWLEELCLRQAVPARLQAGGREHAIELTRVSLVAAADELYRGLVRQVGAARRADEPAAVMLTHRVARLPGLADRLRELPGVTIVELHSSAAASGALQHRDHLRAGGDALPFVTRLPMNGGPRERRGGPVLEFPSRAGARTRATHVLVDGIAHAIGERGLALGTAPPADARGLALAGDGIARNHCTLRAPDGEAVVEDHSTEGTFVNGERVRGRARLRIGDRLRVGSLELLAVAVEDER